jgi:hypothetical protein
VFALPRYLEASLLERLNSPEVRYPGNFWHALSWNLHFP